MEEKKIIKKEPKKFLFRFKIFIWYLLTEPIRNLKLIYVSISKVMSSLNKTVTWIYITLTTTIIMTFFNKRIFAGLFLIMLTLFILLWEWESGHFMHVYREKVKHKIEKKYEDYKKTNMEEK